MLLPYLNENLIEAGCDEAGRGCLAGSVYAAAVILPKDFKNELLNDSKQLTEKQRYALREVIEREAIAWAVGIVSPEEIVLSINCPPVPNTCSLTETGSINIPVSRIPR